MKKHTVAGLMSGSSLDGLDIAVCEIQKSGNTWQYAILQACTVPYPDEWIARLQQVPKGSAEALAQTDAALGRWTGQQTKVYLKKCDIKVDFVASHGHTLLHQPHGLSGYTSQIGHGAWLAAQAGLPVVCDFRTTDVALGGQGAPLVPIGDQMLFGDYTFCLNLGGIANFTYQKDKTVLAYDIGGCNILLNYLADKAGLDYDPSGQHAAKGKINQALLTKMNEWPFLQQKPPRSLGREDVEGYFYHLLDDEKISLPDRLNTTCHHIAEQISSEAQKQVNKYQPENHQKIKGLITGGGAFNDYLIKCLSQRSQNIVWEVPDDLLVQYKEALIFALLGVLRWEGQNNTLAAVTGAGKDSCGGCIYLP